MIGIARNIWFDEAHDIEQSQKKDKEILNESVGGIILISSVALFALTMEGIDKLPEIKKHFKEKKNKQTTKYYLSNKELSKPEVQPGGEAYGMESIGEELASKAINIGAIDVSAKTIYFKNDSSYKYASDKKYYLYEQNGNKIIKLIDSGSFSDICKKQGIQVTNKAPVKTANRRKEAYKITTKIFKSEIKKYPKINKGIDITNKIYSDDEYNEELLKFFSGVNNKIPIASGDVHDVLLPTNIDLKSQEGFDLIQKQITEPLDDISKEIEKELKSKGYNEFKISTYDEGDWDDIDVTLEVK